MPVILCKGMKVIGLRNSLGNNNRVGYDEQDKDANYRPIHQAFIII